MVNVTYAHELMSEAYNLNRYINIATDLINALAGNSSVSTIQHGTIKEAVFSVSAVTSHNGM
jgi:hypothetical protein